MAQIDTGLGWEVSDIWYLNNAGDIASLSYIGGPDFPGQPVPVATTQTDLVAGGFKAAYNPATGRNCDLYVGCTATGKNAVLVVWLEDVKQLGFISSIAADVHFCAYGPSYANKYNFMLTYRDPTTNLYRGTSTQVNNRFGSGDNIVPYCPSFANWDTALAAVQTIVETFSKSNEGPCAAGIVKWQTPTGTIIDSPVLISSKSEYTDMVCTNTSYNLAKLNILKDGINFYMSFFDVVGNRDYQTILTGGVNIPEDYGYTLEQVFEIVASSSYANITIVNPPDPYSQNTEESEEGGGNGENDEEDNVDFTDPPSSSIGATGLLTIFCPNLYQLQSLGSFMWTTFDVDNWRRIIANPMDAILGLHTLPIPAVITGTKAVKVAGIDTTIDMSYTTVRYITRPMGTCEIPKKWGSYLDYSPYTKISIFLPFIGFKELDADDIMGQTISLQYIVDILTGACVAELKCGDTVLYSWSGNCANEVPISGSDWRGSIASAIGIAATVAGTALVTGGATAPMAASMVASVGANSMNLKPTINRSGAISGSAGYMSQKRPYIIRSIPNLVIPTDQNKFIGYPSFVTASLGSLTGYNEIASIHLEGIPATGNELAEIETLLKGGVIF